MTAYSLNWDNPLANQIIDDESDLVKGLSDGSKKTFLKPGRRMIPLNFPAIKEMCKKFLTNFNKHQPETIPKLLKHDATWKESIEVRREIISEILNTIKNIWSNPIFDPNYANSLNEGIYLSNATVPLIQASLKGLPHRKSSFISM